MTIECEVYRPGPRWEWRVVYVAVDRSIVLESHTAYLTKAAARAGAKRFIQRVAEHGLKMAS